MGFINFRNKYMRIALLGYGKMGKMIERIAIERGHEIVLIVDENNRAACTDAVSYTHLY